MRLVTAAPGWLRRGSVTALCIRPARARRAVQPVVRVLVTLLVCVPVVCVRAVCVPVVCADGVHAGRACGPP
jgi:hypothetical protein